MADKTTPKDEDKVPTRATVMEDKLLAADAKNAALDEKNVVAPETVDKDDKTSDKDDEGDKDDDEFEVVVKVPDGYGVIRNATSDEVRAAEAGAPAGYVITPEQMPLPFEGMDPNTAATRRPSTDIRRPY